jgi:MFS family permease
VRRERHAPFPVLDMRFASAPTFAASNLVAFATYFGTFAIFFFCALYLRAVAGDSGYRIAAEFVPMMVAMIGTSLITGRLLARTGLRSPIVAGCLCFAFGLVLTGRALSPHPAYLPLASALALAGAGIGLTMVPTTFAATDAVPIDHAGMASSAINTSREIGAVAGTAVLGAIVNATLVRHLTSEVKPLGIQPKAVIDSVRRGGLRLRESAGSPAARIFATFENKVLHAVYDAFYSALQICLVLSASVVLLAGVVAYVALRNEKPKAPPSRV